MLENILYDIVVIEYELVRCDVSQKTSLEESLFKLNLTLFNLIGENK